MNCSSQPLSKQVGALNHWGLLILLVLLTACTSYQPLYLTTNAVETALKMPTHEQLRMRVTALSHRFPKAIEFNLGNGLSPDEAAILAVLMNPLLTLARDQQGIAEAQLLQAGILPNPTVSYSLEVPVGGNTAGTFTAYGIGVSWDIKALISRAAKIDAAAFKNKKVTLSIAWQEWQVAQAARTAVYQLLALNRQVELGSLFEQALSDNLDNFSQALSRGLVTELELAAAAAAKNTARNRLLALIQEQGQQQLKLKQALGIPNDYPITLQADIKLPNHVDTPPSDQLSSHIDQQRLDLLAFRQGYASQVAAVRTAVLEQFPQISIGPNYASDNGNVVGLGFGISVNLPIFDRNQGMVAIETASRQQLFDEYISRIYQARATIAQHADRLNAIFHPPAAEAG
jgi:outer membrane protein TolC